MKESISNERKRVNNRLRTVALAALAFLLGGMFASPDHRAEAQYSESRFPPRTPPQKAFLSGGARSETVLIEIAHTAKRIEEQLIKIDKSIQQMQTKKPMETR